MCWMNETVLIETEPRRTILESSVFFCLWLSALYYLGIQLNRQCFGYSLRKNTALFPRMDLGHLGHGIQGNRVTGRGEQVTESTAIVCTTTELLAGVSR